MQYVVDAGTWCARALSERIRLVESPEDYLPHSSSTFMLLDDLTIYSQAIIGEFIDVRNRAGGTYNAWYSQFPTSGFGSSESYRASITNPPNWTTVGALEYRQLPSNYWDYTPERLIEIVMPGYTTPHTEQGYSTIDYGWEGLKQILLAMEDMYFAVGHIRQNVSGSNYADCWSNIPPCNVPSLSGGTNQPVAVLSAVIEIGASHSFYGTYEVYSPGGVVAMGGNGISSTRFKYGFMANQPLLDQVETRTDALFQWYDFVWLDVSATILTNVLQISEQSYEEQNGTVSTNYISSGYSLRVSALGHEIDDLGGVGIFPAKVFMATSSWVEPSALNITCPPGWFDTGIVHQASDGPLAFYCPEYEISIYSLSAGPFISSASSGNSRSGYAVGIARPYLEYN